MRVIEVGQTDKFIIVIDSAADGTAGNIAEAVNGRYRGAVVDIDGGALLIVRGGAGLDDHIATLPDGTGQAA